MNSLFLNNYFIGSLESLSTTESFGHLRLNKPRPRYGIPDHRWMNEPHQQQGSLPYLPAVTFPDITVLTPTPTMEDQVKLPIDTEELSPTVTDDCENVKYSPQLHLQELSLSQEDLPQTPLGYDKDQKKKNLKPLCLHSPEAKPLYNVSSDVRNKTAPLTN